MSLTFSQLMNVNKLEISSGGKFKLNAIDIINIDLFMQDCLSVDYKMNQ